MLQEVIVKSAGLWIADSQEAYARAFMEYANLKENHLFQVRMCTREEQLLRALAEEEIEILLITAEWYPLCKERITRECVIFLSEGSLPSELRIYPAVYKYQSAENILREILYYYSEQCGEDFCLTGTRRDNKVIGVYSPVGGSGKTVFALTLGQVLAESKNVLYLNLEECSGLAELSGNSNWNLSDLIYFFRQKNSSFLYRLNSMVRKWDRLDYIPPCDSYMDFRQVAVDEWQKLLYWIRTRSDYDVVVLDLGNMAGHEPEILRQCDGIYVPTGQGLFSQAKLAQWQRYIQILDGVDVLEKLQVLELPSPGEKIGSEEELFALPRQTLGTYIRGLLRE